MKYLLVGLLLAASLARGPASLTPEQGSAYASASFDITTPAGTETTVDLYVSLDAPTSALALRIEQTRRTCDAGGCRETSSLSGFAREQIGPAQAFVSPHLDRAWVHATVPFPDDVSQSTLPLRVDVVWTATGGEQCDAAPISGSGAPDCIRAASAIGDIWTATRNLMTGQTAPDLDLRRSQPAS